MFFKLLKRKSPASGETRGPGWRAEGSEPRLGAKDGVNLAEEGRREVLRESGNACDAPSASTKHRRDISTISQAASMTSLGSRGPTAGCARRVRTCWGLCRKPSGCRRRDSRQIRRPALPSTRRSCPFEVLPNFELRNSLFHTKEHILEQAP